MMDVVGGSQGQSAARSRRVRCCRHQSAWRSVRWRLPTGRQGEYFDHQASSDSTSAKDIFDKIAGGWHRYFLLSDGLLLSGERASKAGQGSLLLRIPWRKCRRHSGPVGGWFDGVDVKYINPVTWAGRNRSAGRRKILFRAKRRQPPLMLP